MTIENRHWILTGRLQSNIEIGAEIHTTGKNALRF